ncbi:AAA family ATPase [Flavobacterium procerum]|uniref:AAA family ATPase n=1 Tax=Flavobacterium procerum TaxID=1455569 RepID=UPI0035E93021
MYDAFIEKIQDSLKAKTPHVYKTLTGKDVTIIEINSNDSIKARAKNSIANRKPAPLTKENLQKLYDKFNNVAEITTLKQVRETVEISPRITEFYAIFKGLKEFEAQEFKPDTDVLDEDVEAEKYDIEEIIKKFNGGVYTNAIKEFGKTAEPVVLIIDEINRGNVSQIFGELITLLEEDKRLGKDEALEVALPYSKEKFGVPSNLYIIGTMNTADRSVESLDTALRRRFCFEEMPPVYHLNGLQNEIFGHKAFEILEKINLRIEKLLDKDHKIGHFYLLNKDEDSIIDSFYKNIIPLLQEYFFGDYSKIGLVLGKGFVYLKESNKESNIFAKFDDFENDFEDRNVYEIIDYRDELDEKMKFGQAIQYLMNK